MKNSYLHNTKTILAVSLILILIMLHLSGCSMKKLPPLKTVASVDIQRFQGKWYVIASIPTWIEKGAHNALESYRLDEDGTIAVTFTFRKNNFDGPLKTYTPRGFILDKTSNAVWGMQFIWPWKAEYLITYLNDDYTQTIIARNNRDYVWIMARTPTIAEEDYAKLFTELIMQGYDTSMLRKVPQRW